MKSKVLKETVYGWGINDSPHDIMTYDETGKRVMCPIYARWMSCIQRAISDKWKLRKPMYLDTTISIKWKFFTSFSIWVEKQPYWQELELDKDILFKDNKEYGPDTCVFIPKYLNSLLQVPSKRGESYIGVVRNKKNGRFSASTQDSISGVGRVALGVYATPEEAHRAWQLGKASVIDRAIKKYEQEIWYREDVANALAQRAQSLRLSAEQCLITTKV